MKHVRALTLPVINVIRRHALIRLPLLSHVVYLSAQTIQIVQTNQVMYIYWKA